MKNIITYIISTNIRAAIYQALLESKTEIDFTSIDSLGVAVASDTIRFLENEKLITIQQDKTEDIRDAAHIS